MIEKLRRKITLIVILSLLLIIGMLVAGINLLNWNSVCAQARETLTTLMENAGERPQARGEKSEEKAPAPLWRSASDSDAEKTGSGETRSLEGRGQDAPDRKPSRAPGQPISSREAMAGLSNSYTVHLTRDGQVKDWSSDREDLYTDRQIADLTAMIVQQQAEFGHVGTQFYLLDDARSLLVVLDARVEAGNARKVLQITLTAGAAFFVILSLGAYILIRRMFRPVHEASEKQKQFVGDASHELKTPLAVISLNAEALRNEAGDSPWVENILQEVDKTRQLVDNLLLLARTESYAEAMPREEVELNRCVEAGALPLECVAYEAGVELELSSLAAVRVCGWKEMLQQLVVILVSNGIKYASAGTQVVIRLERKNRQAVLSIHNQGTVIPEEEQSRIFDRFYRADASRSTQGHGLGLAIARNIVQMHDGHISVSSSREKGTCFTVTLPCSEEGKPSRM